MSWDPILFYEGLQEQSLARARPTTAQAHPREHRLAGTQIHEFLSNMGTLALATVSPAGLPHLTTNHFVVHEGVFWLPFMPGTVRELGVQQVPYASLMIAEGQATYYTMVVVEGPLELVASPSPEAMEAYVSKLGDGTWASAWAAVQPRRLFTYQGENGRYVMGTSMINNMFSSD
ncbi:MAG: pyridoxamine 5'-phosphate oxidase family protein [Candidatus Xenobia bacterium]